MTSPIWDSIYIDNSWAATLISYVGIKVGTTYHVGGSPAVTSNLVSLFYENGIQCSYQEYNPYVVYNHIKDGLPVVTRANDTNAELGHCFIIDAYEEEVKTYSLRYRYIVEQPLEGPLYRITGDNYRIEIRVNPPVLYKFKMNWGGHSSYNNLSFTPAGSWEISDYIYDDNRNIIVGYQQI